MTDRKPHAGTPTAPGKPAPRRPQQRSQPQPGKPAGASAGQPSASQQRPSEAQRPQQRNGQAPSRGGQGQRRPSAPAGGPSNGTARPAPPQPSRDETPTDQIPAVGREAGPRQDAPTSRQKPAPSAKPAARQPSTPAPSSPTSQPSRPASSPGTARTTPPPADPAPPRRERSPVTTVGTIARDTTSPDRTQAIPVIREPLRERDTESSSTTTAPAAPDETTTPEETKPKRRRWGRGRATPDVDDDGATDTATDDRSTAAVEASEPATPTETSKADDSVPAVRKARLRLVRLDPWSVMKTAFALSIALAIVLVVAVTIVWAVLDVAGVWDAINSSVATILSDNADAFDVTDYVGFGRIIGFTILIAGVDVILITAIATVGAFLYNLSASLLGGVEVTLAENS